MKKVCSLTTSPKCYMMHAFFFKLIVVLTLHPPNHGEYDLTTDDVRKVTSGTWLNDKVSEILAS